MPDQFANPAEVAGQIARALEDRSQEYAVGGAIALGYWGQPRGTIDVDLTLFLSPDKVAECIDCLLALGCEVDRANAVPLLREHGFCRAFFRGVRIDVFLPVAPFYEFAKKRRTRVWLGDYQIWIWDAESLAVFKMMFFRRKDLADVEQIIRNRGRNLDRDWIREHLEQMYGQRDPRLAQWNELVAEQS